MTDCGMGKGLPKTKSQIVFEKMGGEKPQNFEEFLISKYIRINRPFENGSIGVQFNLQNAPIKVAGINGIQVDTMILFSKMLIEELNNDIPCEENKDAIEHLGKTLEALAKRTANRKERGVEGENKA